MSNKEILDRAYMVKVLAKAGVKASINNQVDDINQAEALYKIADAALDYYYKLFKKEIEDGLTQ